MLGLCADAVVVLEPSRATSPHGSNPFRTMRCHPNPARPMDADVVSGLLGFKPLQLLKRLLFKQMPLEVA